MATGLLRGVHQVESVKQYGKIWWYFLSRMSELPIKNKRELALLDEVDFMPMLYCAGDKPLGMEIVYISRGLEDDKIDRHFEILEPHDIFAVDAKGNIIKDDPIIL